MYLYNNLLIFVSQVLLFILKLSVMKNLQDDQRSQRNKTFFRLFMPWVSMCLLLFFGSCSEQPEEFEVPETLDDAALVAAQLNQLHRTRANDAYSTVLITTAKSVNFQVAKTGRILVDWGDGNQEYDVFSHTYTDNFPAHTICFYDPDTTMTELGCALSELVFLDVAKNVALKKINCAVNRLTHLDFSPNKHLEEIILLSNRFLSLDFSQNSALRVLNCGSNQITYLNMTNNENLEELVCKENRLSNIDVSKNLKLKKLYCGNNELVSLNLSNNLSLEELDCYMNKIDNLNLTNCLLLYLLNCSYNQIVDLKISNQSNVEIIVCNNNPFEKLNNAVLSFIQGLPNRSGKNSGSIWFSPAINESGSLNIVQSFCDIFNWKMELFE